MIETSTAKEIQMAAHQKLSSTVFEGIAANPQADVQRDIDVR